MLAPRCGIGRSSPQEVRYPGLYCLSLEKECPGARENACTNVSINQPAEASMSEPRVIRSTAKIGPGRCSRDGFVTTDCGGDASVLRHGPRRPNEQGERHRASRQKKAQAARELRRRSASEPVMNNRLVPGPGYAKHGYPQEAKDFWDRSYWERELGSMGWRWIQRHCLLG